MREPSVRLKIERAKEHIKNLKGEIGTFREGRPYRAVFNGKVDDWWLDYVIRVQAEPPPMWSVTVGEAIYNCRSCLDNAWFEMGGRSRRDGFPFHSEPKSFEARFRGKQKAAIQSAVDILRSVESCKAGNPFWTLAELDNFNKHETLLLSSARVGDFTIQHKGGKVFRVNLGPLEEGTIFPIPVGSGEIMDMEYDVPFDIAFSETKITKGEAIIPTLENLVGAADGVLSAFIARGLVR